MRKNSILFFVLILSLSAGAQYQPTQANLQARQWFDSARFGLFIHWGASSVLGAGEWVMNNRNIRVEEYKRLMQFFNPTQFNARAWVKMAKDAGMRYITFITRHHDSFSNWDTKQSDWKITNTVYAKDVLKELSVACNEQGIKLFLYYSLVDWFRSDYPYETGRTGKGTGRTQKSNYEDYLGFMKLQLTELLTGYGDIAGIWFDGHWDQLDNDEDKTQQSKINWKYEEIYELIHRLQPQALVGNNHHLSPLPGEDFQMFEKDLPGENKGGLSGQAVSKLPLETCETINNSWGFNITDRTYKSTKDIIHLLVKAAGYGTNLLLNVGPMPSGEIQPEFVTRLKEVGDWLQKNGTTIYGTKEGAIKPQDWGALTEKANQVYVHILKKTAGRIFFQLPYEIESAFLVRNKGSIAFDKLKDGYWSLDISTTDESVPDDIIVLNIKR
ncbi:MAG: alpha-L-fucosidase [Bacteroidota bacterium]